MCDLDLWEPGIHFALSLALASSTTQPEIYDEDDGR